MTETFGECSACEQLIDLNRLIADPASPYCNECQAYIEAQP
ncbi:MULTISPECIES: TraR/DksA C4-type zinc finger protein [Bacteria]